MRVVAEQRAMAQRARRAGEGMRCESARRCANLAKGCSTQRYRNTGIFEFSKEQRACAVSLPSDTMPSLPSPFTACERVTLQSDANAQTALPPLAPREKLEIGKMLRWTVCKLQPSSSTGEAFDALWSSLGAKGTRHLSVKRDADNVIWARRGLRPTAAFEIPKPGAGQAAGRS